MGNSPLQTKPLFTYPSGNSYLGEWKGSKRHGYGVYTWPDGAVYEGFHAGSKLQGGGKLVFPNGSVYEGFFHNNNPAGRGVLLTVAGERVDGEWTFLGRANNASSTWNSPVGRYRFRGVIVDRKNNRAVMYCGDAALHLATGLVALPTMPDPKEPVFQQAVEVMTATPAEELRHEFGMAQEVEVGIVEAEEVKDADLKKLANGGSAGVSPAEKDGKLDPEDASAPSGIQTGTGASYALAPNVLSGAQYNLFDPRLYFPGLGAPYDYGRARRQHAAAVQQR